MRIVASAVRLDAVVGRNGVKPSGVAVKPL